MLNQSILTRGIASRSTKHHLIRPGVYAAIHEFHIFITRSIENRLGLVTPETDLTEGDNLFISGEFMKALAEQTEGDQFDAGVFDPFLPVLSRRPDIKPDEIIPPVDFSFDFLWGQGSCNSTELIAEDVRCVGGDVNRG